MGPLIRDRIPGWARRAAFAAALIYPFAAVAQQDAERLLFPDMERIPTEAPALAAQADRARRRGDFLAAADLYGRASSAAPDYAPFVRRRCGAEVALGHREQAISLCREAVRLDPAPENLLALAAALGERSGPPRPKHAKEIDELISRAVADNDRATRERGLPNHDDRYLIAACEAVLVMSGTMSLAECMKPPFGGMDPLAREAILSSKEILGGSRRRPEGMAEVLLVLVAMVGLGFVVVAARRRLASSPRYARPLRRVIQLVGREHVLPSLDRERVPAASDVEAVVDELLAITGGAAPDATCRCTERDGARRLTLSVEGRRFRTDLRGETDWIDLDPLLDVLNEALAHQGAPGRLHALDDGRRHQTTGIVYATDDQAAVLRRWGLLTKPFSLPAEDVEELPCRPGTQVDLHPNGRIARATLARDAAVQGIWCAAGSEVQIRRTGAIIRAVLAREHRFGGVAFPAGSQVAFQEGEEAIPVEVVLSAPCRIHGLDLLEGSRVELDGAGSVAGAVPERDVLVGGIPCPAGDHIVLEGGVWRMRLGPGGPYRG